MLQEHVSACKSRAPDICTFYSTWMKKIGKNRNFGAKIGKNSKILKKKKEGINRKK